MWDLDNNLKHAYTPVFRTSCKIDTRMIFQILSFFKLVISGKLLKYQSEVLATKLFRKVLKLTYIVVYLPKNIYYASGLRLSSTILLTSNRFGDDLLKSDYKTKYLTWWSSVFIVTYKESVLNIFWEYLDKILIP